MPKPKPPILLVEDDEVDVMMVQRAFTRHAVTNPLLVAASGDEALQLLHDPEQQRNLPRLVLFDLNMPRMDGITFLQRLRADPLLQSIVAVAITSSNQERDRLTLFRHHVAGYFVKPVSYEAQQELFGTIARYWMLSQLP